jgi:hypothetical protein
MSESSVERTLGILLGKVEGIEDRLERAHESRAGIHRRREEVVMRTTHLESDVMSVKAKTDAIQSVTDDVKKMRQQAQGAGTMGHWLIRIGIGIVTAAGWLAAMYTWATAALNEVLRKSPPCRKVRRAFCVSGIEFQRVQECAARKSCATPRCRISGKRDNGHPFLIA